MNDDKEKLINCLEESGIIVDEDGTLPDMESIMFITMVLSIEEQFGIEFPDDYLNTTYFGSVDDILNFIKVMRDGECVC